jgi:hypothetical protein
MCRRVPPNVTFEVDDIEAEWCFSQRFDYIHCRYLAGAIGDWPRLMEQTFKFTKPGGWVEFADFDARFYSSDGTFTPGCAADEWCDELVLALEAMGYDPEPGPKLEKWVTGAGFTNVNYQCFPIPVGIWPKDKRMVRFENKLDSGCIFGTHFANRKRLGPAISPCSWKGLKPFPCVV